VLRKATNIEKIGKRIGRHDLTGDGLDNKKVAHVSDKTKIRSRSRTHVVKAVLSTKMQQRVRKVPHGHRQSIIQRPQRRPKAVRKPRQAPTRRRVGLEHDQGEVLRPREVGRVVVQIEEGADRLVVQEAGEGPVGVDVVS